MTLSISKLAQKYGLSRSTLLYYDKIDLLSPNNHTRGEYRFYGQEEAEKLKLICRYRKAGVPLKDIKKILESPESDFSSILQERFRALNKEIQDLHKQQHIIAGLLKNSADLEESGVMNKKLWVSILAKAGFSEADMRNWHIRFEQNAPKMHHHFLNLLQIPNKEITAIRSWK